MGYEVDNLITDLRDDVQASASSETSLTAQLLRSLNREQRLFLSAELHRMRGNHKHATLELSANGSTVRFDVPVRAIAAGIVFVEAVGSSGDRRKLYTLGSQDFAANSPKPGDFYVEGNELVFYQAPPTGTLRVTYNRRLSKLVLLASVGIITGINTGTGVVAISPVPSAFGTSAANYDFVRATPHFDLLAMDKSATRSSGNMTFSAADLPSRLAVGDHVCLSGESAVVQAPLELHRVLSLRSAYMWTRAKNDPLANALKEDLGDAIRDATELLDPRIDDDDAMVNPNGPGWTNGKGSSVRRSGVAP